MQASKDEGVGREMTVNKRSLCCKNDSMLSSSSTCPYCRSQIYNVLSQTRPASCILGRREYLLCANSHNGLHATNATIGHATLLTKALC